MYQRTRSQTHHRQTHQLSEFDLSNDSKYKKSKSKGCNKNKNSWKRTKQDSSDSLSIESDLYEKSDYRRNRLKHKKKN